MAGIRETRPTANWVVERKVQTETNFWKGVVDMTVHAIIRCLSRKDRRGAEYYAQMQGEANQELISWERW